MKCVSHPGLSHGSCGRPRVASVSSWKLNNGDGERPYNAFLSQTQTSLFLHRVLALVLSRNAVTIFRGISNFLILSSGSLHDF